MTNESLFNRYKLINKYNSNFKEKESLPSLPENEQKPSKKNQILSKLPSLSIFSHLIGQVCIVLSFIVAGHLGDTKKLAAVGVSHSYLSILILPVILGVNKAQDSAVPYAFDNGDLRACGMYLNRGRAICIALFSPLCLLTLLYH